MIKALALAYLVGPEKKFNRRHIICSTVMCLILGDRSKLKSLLQIRDCFLANEYSITSVQCMNSSLRVLHPKILCWKSKDLILDTPNLDERCYLQSSPGVREISISAHPRGKGSLLE